jgi:hypothetical protein
MKIEELRGLNSGARLKNTKNGKEGFYLRLQGHIVAVLWDKPGKEGGAFTEEHWPIEEVEKA